MKKLAIVLMAAVAISASADLTGWNFLGGASLTDQSGAAIANGGATVFTLPNVDLSLLVAGGEIQLADINGGYLEFAIASSTVPFGPTAGQWGTAGNLSHDGSIVGQSVYAMVVSRAGLTALSEIVAGDYVGFTANVGSFEDLQLDPTLPAAAAQVFNGGAVQTDTVVTAIPEPATLGLMGIAGLGLFLARKKARG